MEQVHRHEQSPAHSGHTADPPSSLHSRTQMSEASRGRHISWSSYNPRGPGPICIPHIPGIMGTPGPPVPSLFLLETEAVATGVSRKPSSCLCQRGPRSASWLTFLHAESLCRLVAQQDQAEHLQVEGQEGARERSASPGCLEREPDTQQLDRPSHHICLPLPINNQASLDEKTSPSMAA